MKIRVLSDLHNEFNLFVPPPREDDNECVLVLAGDVDLHKSTRLPQFLLKCSEQFRDVVYVFGNHEYYGGSIVDARKKVLDQIQYEALNLHILENDHIVINDVCFVGATLWSDFDNRNALVMHAAQQYMNDYRQIRIGTQQEPWKKKLLPVDTLHKHDASKKYIFETIYTQTTLDRKVVVVTHHSPSWQGVAECYRGSFLNGCYHSNLEEEVISSKPNLWVHGHTHVSLDYMIGDTRILCNPRGYITQSHGEENPQFDPTLVVEI